MLEMLLTIIFFFCAYNWGSMLWLVLRFIVLNNCFSAWKFSFKVIISYSKIITTRWCLRLAPKQKIAHEEWSPATNLDLAASYCGTTTRTKGGSVWALRVKLVPNNMGVYFANADSFKIDHFDQYFHLIFWLKANNDTVVTTNNVINYR